MSRIKCMVEECVYNSNTACSAQQIEVCSCNCTNVNKAGETECHTFKHRSNY